MVTSICQTHPRKSWQMRTIPKEGKTWRWLRRQLSSFSDVGSCQLWFPLKWMEGWWISRSISTKFRYWFWYCWVLMHSLVEGEDELSCCGFGWNHLSDGDFDPCPDEFCLVLWGDSDSWPIGPGFNGSISMHLERTPSTFQNSLGG